MRIYRIANTIQIYQGQNVYNKNSPFYTTDKEWARQFTQSGLEKEVKPFLVDSSQIYSKEILPLATNEESLDEGIQEAKENGFKALWVNEGINEPNSIYVLDKSILKSL